MYEVMLVCLMAANISLSEEVREVLVETAISMARDGKRKLSFKIDSAEGVIQKETDYTPFMGNGGPTFSVEIETNLGKGKVRFITPERYLQAVAAGDTFSESFHVEHDHRRTANARWN